jgi:hypothetical protein
VEIILEPLVELLGGLLLVAVAYTVGSVIFLLVRAVRLSLRSLDPQPEVVDPRGQRWVVRVGLAPPPLRYRISAWFFRMRPDDRVRRVDRRDVAADGVDRNEIAHPSGLVERFDEAAGLAVWAILAVTMVAVVVFVFEVLLVAVVAAVAFAVRTLRSRWQCEVVAPDGHHFHVPAGSLLQARDERERVRSEIAAGVYRIHGCEYSCQPRDGRS